VQRCLGEVLAGEDDVKKVRGGTWQVRGGSWVLLALGAEVRG